MATRVHMVHHLGVLPPVPHEARHEVLVDK